MAAWLHVGLYFMSSDLEGTLVTAETISRLIHVVRHHAKGAMFMEFSVLLFSCIGVITDRNP